MIKVFERTVIKGTNINTIRAIYSKSAANTKLKGEKLKNDPTEIRNRTRLSTLSIPIQYST